MLDRRAVSKVWNPGSRAVFLAYLVAAFIPMSSAPVSGIGDNRVLGQPVDDSLDLDLDGEIDLEGLDDLENGPLPGLEGLEGIDDFDPAQGSTIAPAPGAGSDDPFTDMFGTPSEFGSLEGGARRAWNLLNAWSQRRYVDGDSFSTPLHGWQRYRLRAHFLRLLDADDPMGILADAATGRESKAGRSSDRAMVGEGSPLDDLDDLDDLDALAEIDPTSGHDPFAEEDPFSEDESKLNLPGLEDEPNTRGSESSGFGESPASRPFPSALVEAVRTRLDGLLTEDGSPSGFPALEEHVSKFLVSDLSPIEGTRGSLTS